MVTVKRLFLILVVASSFLSHCKKNQNKSKSELQDISGQGHEGELGKKTFLLFREPNLNSSSFTSDIQISYGECPNGRPISREICTINKQSVSLPYFLQNVDQGILAQYAQINEDIGVIRQQIETLNQSTTLDKNLLKDQVTLKDQERQSLEERLNDIKSRYNDLIGAYEILLTEGIIIDTSTRTPSTEKYQKSVRQMAQIFYHRREFLAEEFFSCLRHDNGLECWGDTKTMFPESALKAPKTVRAIALSRNRRCYISRNDNGSVVRCRLSEQDAPLYEDLLVQNPYQVVAGIDFTCALEPIACNGSMKERIPSQLSQVSAIAGGDNHVCALDRQGVRCWTDNNSTRLTNVPPLERPRAIFSGPNSACAVDANGFTCWGDEKLSSPPPKIKQPTSVAIGRHHACAIENSSVICWGDNESHELNVPANIQNPKIVAVGLYHTCVAHASGVTCWGDDHHDQGKEKYIENYQLDL